MSKTTLFVLVSVGAVLLIGIAIYLFRAGYMPAGMQNSGSNSTPTSTTSVDIKDFAFNPSNIEVKVGDTVTWTNSDSTTHRIASDTFNSSDMPNGAKYQFTFQNAGTFNYHCSIHPSMTGTVTVK